MKKILSVYLIIFMMVVGCTKNDPEKVVNIENSIPNVLVKEVKSVNKDSRNFDDFLKSESFQILKENISGFKIESIQSVTFDNSAVLGFIIKINDLNGFSRDLMTVYKINEIENFTTLIRENNVNNSNGNVNGDVIWYTATYEKLNEMKIKDGKVSYFKLYTSGQPFSLKNARFASTQACTWQCTKDDFNCEYQSAKDSCESDWLCDFSCSFNRKFVITK